jgi:hypothetical protein
VSAVVAPTPWTGSRRVVGALLVAFLALLAGPALPRLVAAEARHHASPAEPSAAHPAQPLLRSATAPRPHATGMAPSPTASLSARRLRPASAPPVGQVSHERPGGAGDSPFQQPSSRGPPR